VKPREYSPTLSANTAKPEIHIGEFTLTYLSDGTPWLCREGGEGMGMNEDTLRALESVIEEFWKAHF
jgi:hypothetical protein